MRSGPTPFHRLNAGTFSMSWHPSSKVPQELSAPWGVVPRGQTPYTPLTQIEVLSLSPQFPLPQHFPALPSFKANYLHRKEQRKLRGVWLCAPLGHQINTAPPVLGSMTAPTPPPAPAPGRAHQSSTASGLTKQLGSSYVGAAFSPWPVLQTWGRILLRLFEVQLS